MLQAACHLLVFCMVRHDLMQAVARGGEAAQAGAEAALCDEDCSQAFPEVGIADGPDRPQTGTLPSEALSLARFQILAYPESIGRPPHKEDEPGF